MWSVTQRAVEDLPEPDHEDTIPLQASRMLPVELRPVLTHTESSKDQGFAATGACARQQLIPTSHVLGTAEGHGGKQRQEAFLKGVCHQQRNRT